MSPSFTKLRHKMHYNWWNVCHTIFKVDECCPAKYHYHILHSKKSTSKVNRFHKLRHKMRYIFKLQRGRIKCRPSWPYIFLLILHNSCLVLSDALQSALLGCVTEILSSVCLFVLSKGIRILSNYFTVCSCALSLFWRSYCKERSSTNLRHSPAFPAIKQALLPLFQNRT